MLNGKMTGAGQLCILSHSEYIDFAGQLWYSGLQHEPRSITCAVSHHVHQVRVHNAMIGKQHESELPQPRQGDDTLVIVLWETTYMKESQQRYRRHVCSSTCDVLQIGSTGTSQHKE